MFNSQQQKQPPPPPQPPQTAITPNGGLVFGGRRPTARRQFKRGLDGETSRRKREELSIELRQKNREENISRKRHQLGQGSFLNAGSASPTDAKTATAATTATAAAPPNTGVSAATALAALGPIMRKASTLPDVILTPSAKDRMRLDKCQEISKRTALTVSTQPTIRTVSQQYLMELAQVGEAINSEDVKTQTMAATKLRKMLSIQYQPPVQEVIDCGAVPRLLYLISNALRTPKPPTSAGSAGSADHQLEFEALWACTNIASGSSLQTRHVVECGAVPIMVNCLRSPNEDLWDQAVWAIGNIAGDSSLLRDYVLSTPALEWMLSGGHATKLGTLRNVAWTLSNFCRGKPAPKWEIVGKAVPALAKLLTLKDPELLVDTCWALSHLADDTTTNNVQVEALVKVGIIPRMVELLASDIMHVRVPALRMLGHVASGEDSHTDAVVRAGLVPLLHKMLSDPKTVIRKDACWTISNIMAGPREHIQAVIDARLIAPLVLFVRSTGGVDYETRKEATWALSNATEKATPVQIQYMVNQGLLAAMCDQLRSPEPKIVLVAMDAIDNALSSAPADDHKAYLDLMDEADGLELLEKLRVHENTQVYEKSAEIIQKYFTEQEENEDSDNQNSAPAPASIFGFADPK